MIKIKKIVAIITTFTFLFTAAGPAASATIEELQAQIADLLALISSLSSQLAALQGGAGTTISGCTISSFTRSLKTGMSGDDVKCLQIVLNTDSATQVASSGVGSPGNETSYFGSLTTAAVIKFQEKYASEVLATYGLTSGTGYVGTTTKAKLNSLLGAGAGTGETGTAAIVSLAVGTPAASQTALNAQDVMFTKVKFSAGATAYTVSSIIVTRSGVAADADISSIKLYDGTTQLGSTQALNTTTHKASFSGLNWTIPAYSVKYLTIKGGIAASGTATVGDSIKLGIYTATDITSTLTPSGTFPIWGNAKTIAGISVGNLDVDKQSSPATTTVLSGSTDQQIACWKFAASSTEGFNLHSMKITHVGTAAQTDLSNLVLKVSGAQIGSSVASLDTSNALTFDLSSSPLSINAGSSKTVCAYADISGGIWTSRTVKFEITQYTDVVAYGANSGGATTVTYSTGTAFAKQTGNTMTISQGTFTIALDAAENPSGQNYVKGTSNRSMTAFKFSTGSREGVRVTKIVMTLTGSGTATDLSNVTLWDGTTQIAGPASVIGSTVTFGANTVGYDSTGLFDVASSQTKTLVVKADIPTGATTDHTLILSISAASNVWADGLDSQYDLPSGAITGSAIGNTHTVSASGSLAVSLSASTPAAQSYVKGTINKTFTEINLTAGSGEDIFVSAITFRCYEAGTGTGDACDSGDVTNVKVLKSDGSQYGSTIAAPATSAAFTGNLTVAAAQTVSLKVVADIPSTSGAVSLHFDLPGTENVYDEINSAGASSAADITETGSATGKLITVGEGTLVISAAPTPADQTLIIGASEASLVAFSFTAGTGEDVRITRILLKRACLTGHACASGDASNLALYEGSTRLTAVKGWDSANSTNTTFTSSDFLNSSGITITAGQQKVITVKGDIPSTATDGNDFSIGIATSTDPSSSTTSDVTFVGLSSNTTPDATISKASSDLEGANYSSYGHADAYYVTLTTAGVLTVQNSANRPDEAIQSVSIQGIQIPNVTFHLATFAATLEEIDIKSISVSRSGGRDANFASITLWDGTTQLGSAQTLSNGSTTFSFTSENYWRLPTVGVKTLTIKGTLNGIRTVYGYGSETGDAPKLGVDTITAIGVSSGDATLGSEVDKFGYVMHLRQGQPTVALTAPTSGTYGAGEKELIRFTVSADAYSDITWQKVVFDVSGSVSIGTTGYTVGCVSGNNTCAAKTDGVYMSTSSYAVATSLIATSTMKLYDVATGQITASTTATAWTVDQNTSTGTARIAFVPSAEQVIGASGSKTYYLLANPSVAGSAGDSIMTKIASRATTAESGDTYANVATTAATFVWSDKSGASAGAHSSGTSDWTDEYKVSGLPTASKTLSK